MKRQIETDNEVNNDPLGDLLDSYTEENARIAINKILIRATISKAVRHKHWGFALYLIARYLDPIKLDKDIKEGLYDYLVTIDDKDLLDILDRCEEENTRIVINAILMRARISQAVRYKYWGFALNLIANHPDPIKLDKDIKYELHNYLLIDYNNFTCIDFFCNKLSYKLSEYYHYYLLLPVKVAPIDYQISRIQGRVFQKNFNNPLSPDTLSFPISKETLGSLIDIDTKEHDSNLEAEPQVVPEIPTDIVNKLKNNPEVRNNIIEEYCLSINKAPISYVSTDTIPSDDISYIMEEAVKAQNWEYVLYLLQNYQKTLLFTNDAQNSISRYLESNNFLCVKFFCNDLHYSFSANYINFFELTYGLRVQINRMQGRMFEMKSNDSPARIDFEDLFVFDIEEHYLKLNYITNLRLLATATHNLSEVIVSDENGATKLIKIPPEIWHNIGRYCAKHPLPGQEYPPLSLSMSEKIMKYWQNKIFDTLNNNDVSISHN